MSVMTTSLMTKDGAWIASAGRFMYQNIRGGAAHFLLGGLFALIGLVHSCIPIPCSIRTYNPTTLITLVVFFSERCDRRKVHENSDEDSDGDEDDSADFVTFEQVSCRVFGAEDLKEEFRNHQFRTVVVRTTGKPRLFIGFAKWLHDKNYHTERRWCYIPKADEQELGWFEEFLQEGGYTMTAITSDQFSLAGFPMKNVGEYITFLRRFVRGELDALVDGFFDQTKNSQQKGKEKGIPERPDKYRWKKKPNGGYQ